MKAPVTQALKEVPLHIKSEAINHLSSFTQFHGLCDHVLIRLAKRRTGLKVPDRWVAIALILGNRVPIPVPFERQKKTETLPKAAPPKLIVITGGRIGR